MTEELGCGRIPKYVRLDWSHDDTKRLAQLYLAHECLWNPEHPKHNLRMKRRVTYQKILKIMNKKSLTYEAMILRIQDFRSKYAKCLRNLKKHDEEGKVFRRKWILFDMFDPYLREIVEGKMERKMEKKIERKTGSSIAESSHQSGSEATEPSDVSVNEANETERALYNIASPKNSDLLQRIDAVPTTLEMHSGMDSRVSDNSKQHEANTSSQNNPPEWFARQLSQLLRSLPTENASPTLQVTSPTNHIPTARPVTVHPIIISTDENSTTGARLHSEGTYSHNQNSNAQDNTDMESRMNDTARAESSSTVTKTEPEDDANEAFGDQLLQLMRFVPLGKRKMQMQLVLQQTVMQYVDG